MPTQRYTLPSGDVAHEIEITWSGIWKNASVKCDGHELGTFENQKDLREGNDFSLPDGRSLRVQLVSLSATTELHVLCDGEPVPGSASDPGQRLKQAYQTVFFVAALNVVGGLLVEVFKIPFFVNLGVGVDSIVVGVLFLILGFFVKRRSTVALGIAMSLFVLGGILTLFSAALDGRNAPIGGLAARVFLSIPMIRGFGALRALKRQHRVGTGEGYGSPPIRRAGELDDPNAPADWADQVTDRNDDRAQCARCRDEFDLAELCQVPLWLRIGAFPLLLRHPMVFSEGNAWYCRRCRRSVNAALFFVFAMVIVAGLAVAIGQLIPPEIRHAHARQQ